MNILSVNSIGAKIFEFGEQKNLNGVSLLFCYIGHMILREVSRSGVCYDMALNQEPRGTISTAAIAYVCGIKVAGFFKALIFYREKSSIFLDLFLGKGRMFKGI